MLMNSLSKIYKNKMGIYFIQNSIDGKIYIGSSCNLYKRNYEHRRLLNKGNHYNKHLQSAFNKYGSHNFRFGVLQTVSNIEELIMLEPNFIRELHLLNDSNGYNFVESYKGTHGMKFSKERCKSISQALKGRVAHNKGKKMSEEQRTLLIKVRTKQHGKPVKVYFNNLLIEISPSINYIVRNYPIDKRSLQRMLNGEYSQFKNYKFKYAAPHSSNVMSAPDELLEGKSHIDN